MLFDYIVYNPLLDSTSTTKRSDKSSANKTGLYLASVVPLVVVLLIVITLILCFLHRKQR